MFADSLYRPACPLFLSSCLPVLYFSFPVCLSSISRFLSTCPLFLFSCQLVLWFSLPVCLSSWLSSDSLFLPACPLILSFCLIGVSSCLPVRWFSLPVLLVYLPACLSSNSLFQSTFSPILSSCLPVHLFSLFLPNLWFSLSSACLLFLSSCLPVLWFFLPVLLVYLPVCLSSESLFLPTCPLFLCVSGGHEGCLYGFQDEHKRDQIQSYTCTALDKTIIRKI